MPESMRLDDVLKTYTPDTTVVPADVPVSGQVPINVLNQHQSVKLVDKEHYNTWYENLFQKAVSTTEGAPDVILESSVGALKALPDLTNEIIAAGLRFSGDMLMDPEAAKPKDAADVLAMTSPLAGVVKGLVQAKDTFAGQGNAEEILQRERKTGMKGKGQELSALGFYLHSQTKNFQEKMAGQLDHPVAFDLGSAVGQLSFSFLAATVNPQLAIAAITGQVSATKYLENRAKNVPWTASAAFSATVGLGMGQLEKITLGLLSKQFYSRLSLTLDAAISSGIQESAQSIFENTADEIIGDRDFDPVEDIRQAAYEGAIGMFAGGIAGLTTVNYAYNRVKKNLEQLGVGPRRQESLATELLKNGGDIISTLIKENSGVTDQYLDDFGKAMAGQQGMKEFFIKVDGQHDNDLKKRFVNLKTDTAKVEQLIQQQEVTDTANEIANPAAVPQVQEIQPDIEAAARVIIQGRQDQLEQEIMTAEGQISALNEELATLQTEGRGAERVLDKISQTLTHVDELYTQQRDLTDYTVDELEKQKILVKGQDVERVRKVARTVGEQQERTKLKKIFREKTASVQEVKDAIVHFVNKHIPKANRGEFLIAVRDAKTDKNLRDIGVRIYEKADEYQSKILKGKIEERLDKLKPSLDQNRNQKGRFGSAAIQDVADYIRRIAKMTKEQTDNKIVQNLEAIFEIVNNGKAGDPALLAFENEMLTDFGGIAERSVEDLGKSLSALKDVTRNLRTFGQAVMQEAAARKEQRFAKIQLEILPPLMEAKLERIQNTVMGHIREFKQKMFGWGAGSSFNLGTILKFLDNTKSGKGELSQLADEFIDATRREYAYNTRMVDLFQTAFKDVYGLKNASQIEEKMRKDLSFKKEDGASDRTIQLNNGKSKALKLNRATIRYWYALSHNAEGDILAEAWETLTGQNAHDAEYKKAQDDNRAVDLSQVKGNAIPEVELQDLFSTLTQQDIDFANRQRQFYSFTYLMINGPYRRVTGVNLPQVENYFPIARKVDQADENLFSMLEDVSSRFAASKPGALKLRNEMANSPFKQLGDVQIMSNMILEMSHFLGSFETVRDAFSILRDPGIREAINKVSDGKQAADGDWQDGTTYKSLLSYTQMVGSRGKLHLKIHEVGQKISNNISSGLTSAQLETGLIQVMSMNAALEKMPLADFKEGVVDFFNNPGAAAKLLGRSPIMRMRYQNIVLELMDLAKSEKMNTLTRKQDWRSHLFLPMKLGDRGSVLLGGWTVFRYEYNKTNDIKEAYKAFDHYVETTQQSGSLTQLSGSQIGYWRVFFKFLSAPQQYFRREMLIMNDFAKGRIPFKDALKGLLVYHFILSGFFNLMQNMFKIDPQDAAKSILVGPIVGIPLLGSFIEQLFLIGTNAVQYAITGEESNKRPFDVNLPALSLINDIKDALDRVEKDYEKDEFFLMMDAMIVAGENTAAITKGVPKQFGELARGILAVSQDEIPVEALGLLLYGRTLRQVKDALEDE
jgi:hypothetical protein